MEQYLYLAGAYFDESFDEFPNPSYTVAGFVGHGYAAVHLDLRWKDLLKKHNLRYFKASEIEFGFGEIRQYRDDPNDIAKPLSKREKDICRNIKTDFVNAICDHPAMRGIGVCMLLRDLAALKNEHPELAVKLQSPYVLCSEIMLVEAGIMVNSNNKALRDYPAVLRPVFDSHEVYEPIIRGGFDLFCKLNPESSVSLLPPIFECDKEYRCLQASDCLAFEARKLLINTQYEPTRPERIAMKRLKENSIDVLYKLDYAALKLIASDYTVPIDKLIAPSINNRPARATKISSAPL